MKEKILVGTSFIIGIIGNILGGFDTFLIAFIAIMGIDYIFGVVCAISKGEYSWNKGARGIGKKFALLIIVALGQLLDTTLNTQNVIRISVLMFYIANDLLSIIEHMVVLDIPVPPMIEKVVEVFKNESDQDI